MKDEYIPPTLDDLINATTKLEIIANDLAFYRGIEGLSDEDKEEIWDICLELTRYSSALSRICMLNLP